MSTTELAIRELSVGSRQIATISDVTNLGIEVANALSTIVEDNKLYVLIKKKKYVMVEGWTTMGAFLGATAVITGTEIRDDGSCWARAELRRTTDSFILGAAEAVCGTPDDKDWVNRSTPHKLSMAQTRAVGKAFRLTYAWIMTLSGYETTPYEEMSGLVIDGEVVPESGTESDFRRPLCYEHGDPIELVWREGSSEKGDYAFWGCRHWSPDGGCKTSSNAPGPNEQELADDYWTIVGLALDSYEDKDMGTDLTSSYVEGEFTKALLGDPIQIKYLDPDVMELVAGYWTIVGDKEEMPENEFLGHGDKFRNGRKALAKYTVQSALSLHGPDTKMSFVDAYTAVCAAIESGSLVFAKVKAKRGTTIELLPASEVTTEE